MERWARLQKGEKRVRRACFFKREKCGQCEFAADGAVGRFALRNVPAGYGRLAVNGNSPRQRPRSSRGRAGAGSGALSWAMCMADGVCPMPCRGEAAVQGLCPEEGVSAR